MKGIGASALQLMVTAVVLVAIGAGGLAIFTGEADAFDKATNQLLSDQPGDEVLGSGQGSDNTPVNIDPTNNKIEVTWQEPPPSNPPSKPFEIVARASAEGVDGLKLETKELVVEGPNGGLNDPESPANVVKNKGCGPSENCEITYEFDPKSFQSDTAVFQARFTDTDGEQHSSRTIEADIQPNNGGSDTNGDNIDGSGGGDSGTPTTGVYFTDTGEQQGSLAPKLAAESTSSEGFEEGKIYVKSDSLNNRILLGQNECSGQNTCFVPAINAFPSSGEYTVTAEFLRKGKVKATKSTTVTIKTQPGYEEGKQLRDVRTALLWKCTDRAQSFTVGGSQDTVTTPSCPFDSLLITGGDVSQPNVYDKLERFRNDNSIQAWKHMKTANTMITSFGEKSADNEAICEVVRGPIYDYDQDGKQCVKN